LLFFQLAFAKSCLKVSEREEKRRPREMKKERREKSENKRPFFRSFQQELTIKGNKGSARTGSAPVSVSAKPRFSGSGATVWSRFRRPKSSCIGDSVFLFPFFVALFCFLFASSPL
jgi:hypothetical protein